MNFLGGLACFCSSACKAMGMLAKKMVFDFLGCMFRCLFVWGFVFAILILND